MEVNIPDWDFCKELERRKAAGSVFVAKNGRAWPRRCPVCGGEVKEYGVSIDPLAEGLLKSQYRREALRHLVDGVGRHLPDLNTDRPGTYHLVQCAAQCTWVEWHTDLDRAREQFFDNAERAKEEYGYGDRH